MAKRTKKKAGNGLPIWFWTLILALALAGAAWAYNYYQSLYGKAVLNTKSEYILFVSRSETFESLKAKIDALNCLEDFSSFDKAAALKKLDRNIKPGKYKITAGMSAVELVTKLKLGLQEPVRVKLNQESTIDEISASLAKQLEPDSLELSIYFKQPEVATKFGFKPETFISLFIPNTYEFFWAASKEDIVNRFSKEYKKVWNENRLQKAQNIGLSPSEVSTLASIVAQETAKPSEAPIIAGVYLNRLKKGMPLQADPTLRFIAKNKDMQRVLNVHKEINSPYNTYLNKGLPPGPIGLADVRFIDAVLNYQKHPYLYFCAKDDLSGYSLFTASYAEHQINARKYQRALNQRGIFK